MLDKLQKCVCWTLGPPLVSSLDLAHHRKVAILKVFYYYYFCRCLSELAELFLLLNSQGRCTRYSNSACYSAYLFITFARCYKYNHVNSFSPPKIRLWNSLHAELFPLTYDLNGFKTINSLLLSLGSFLFPICFSSFSSIVTCNLSLPVAIHP